MPNDYATTKILDFKFNGYVKKSEKNHQLGAKLVRYTNQNIEQIDLIEQSLPHLEKPQEKLMRRFIWGY